jgi:hypothetical protein
MPHLETDFSQFELVTEAEERHKLFGRDGKLKLLALSQSRPDGRLQ